MDYSVYKAKPTYFFSRPPLHPSCYGTRQVGALPAAHASRALLLVRFPVRLPYALSHDPASSHFLPAPQQTSPTAASLTLSCPHPDPALLQPWPPRRTGAGLISRSASICHCRCRSRCRCCLLPRLSRSPAHLDSLEPVTRLADPKACAQTAVERRSNEPPPSSFGANVARPLHSLCISQRIFSPCGPRRRSTANTWAQCADRQHPRVAPSIHPYCLSACRLLSTHHTT